MVYVPPFAPIVTLAFLGAGFLILAGSAAALFGLLAKHRALAVGGGAVAAVVLAGYAALWAGAALASRERVLKPGERKYFCEIDCHLAYSVPRLEAVGTDGATGTNLWLLTVRTRFDPATISPRRPLTAPTWPAPRRVMLVDATGREFPPLPEAAAEASPHLAGSIPITQPLAPGEAYETRFVFRLPSDAVPSRLLLQDDLFINQLLIGNERSPFHRPVYLALPMKV
jgi:hypothetical protein